MIAYPRAVVRAAYEAGKLEELQEWCLNTDDVAALLTCSRTAVVEYRKNGKPDRKRGGMVKLPFRSFGWGTRRVSVIAYRLQDVETFAGMFGWALEYDTLPRALQEKYSVGMFNPREKTPEPLGVLVEPIKEVS